MRCSSFKACAQRINFSGICTIINQTAPFDWFKRKGKSKKGEKKRKAKGVNNCEECGIVNGKVLWDWLLGFFSATQPYFVQLSHRLYYFSRVSETGKSLTQRWLPLQGKLFPVEA